MAVVGQNVIEGRTSLFTVFRKAAETLRHYNLDNMESLRRLLRLGPLPPGKWAYGCIFFSFILNLIIVKTKMLKDKE